MRTIPAIPVPTRSLLLCGTLILLGGCATEHLERTFGLIRDAPDEYTVTTRAPLSMPPDYNLRPPRPGVPRPQEQTERQQAQDVLVPQSALDAPKVTASAGQAALIQEAGPPVQGDIRRQADQDARYAANDPGFIGRVLNWGKPSTEPVEVDAQKEAQRLRQNAALGASPVAGETPIIEQKKKGWFGGLFDWL